MCTSPGPTCDELLFGDRDSWFEHELQAHRASYRCLLCNLGPLSRPALRQHLSTSHPGFNDSQLTMLEEGGRGIVKEFPPSDCPFCSEWDSKVRQRSTGPSRLLPNLTVLVNTEEFKDHVAAHQEELALLALPTLPRATIGRPERSQAIYTMPLNFQLTRLDKLFPRGSKTDRIYREGRDPLDEGSWVHARFADRDTDWDGDEPDYEAKLSRGSTTGTAPPRDGSSLDAVSSSIPNQLPQIVVGEPAHSADHDGYDGRYTREIESVLLRDPVDDMYEREREHMDAWEKGRMDKRERRRRYRSER